MPRGKHSENQKRDGRGRFAKIDMRTGEIVQRREPDQVATPPFASVVELQRSYISHFTRVLQRSDMALRHDRVLQREMRRDPDVMGPLFQRQSAVALLDWEIIPHDKDDEEQVEQAAQLDEIFRGYIQSPFEFVRSLLDAVWFGPAAVQITPEQDGDLVVPGEWMPIHSDTLAFNEVGDLGLYVSSRYEGEKIIGPQGMIHMLDDDEREQIILHTHGRQGPDYEISVEAAYQYAGRGLRDVVFWQWLLKQTCLQHWATYLERYSLGIRIGTYPDGNDAAKNVMEEVMTNLVGDVSVLIPRQPGEAKDAYSIEVQEPNASQAKIFADLIEGYLSGQIKELIIGQQATTEAVSTGLGSSVADQHAETFRRITQSDAMNLANTLTRELVDKYHVWNFGDTEHRPRWSFSLEKNDPKDFMEGVRSFVELGGAVSQQQAREILGLTEPEEGESVLSSQQQQQGDMGAEAGGGDFLSSLMGGAPQPPNGAAAEQQFRKFSKALANAKGKSHARK